MNNCLLAWLGGFCLATALLASLPSAAFAQDSMDEPRHEELSYFPPARTARNVLFVELLGNAALYSVNYARFITDDISLRFGFEYVSLSVSSSGSSSGSSTTGNASLLFVPIMLNYYGIGSLDHKLELGIGPMFGYASASVDTGDQVASGRGLAVGGTAVIGYRYIPHDGGFTFNVGFTPIFGIGGFMPWLGLGFGAAF
jgi:hypothetical protein